MLTTYDALSGPTGDKKRSADVPYAAASRPSDGAGRSKAVIIGSGFGGLAAAVRLIAKGYSVEVLERLENAGGRASVFRQDGFTFDAGPTVITVPQLFNDLWTLLGERFEDYIDLRPIDPFYNIRFNDGRMFFYNGDAEAMERQVAAISPGDLEGYRAFMRHSDRLRAIVFDQLGHVPFTYLSDLLKVTPDLIRHGGLRPVYSVVSGFVKDERIRQICCFHPLFIGGNPLAASSAYAMIPSLERKWGVHFPMGGTGALVTGLVDLIERHGGRFRYKADVDEILVERGQAQGVKLTDGTVVKADIVISNADSATTYNALLRAHPAHRWAPARLKRARYSMGVFVWYFGLDRRYDSVGQHTKVMGDDFNALLRSIFNKRSLSDDLCLYVHRPTQIDPSLAPPGCDTYYALSPIPNLSSGTDWATMAEPYRQRIAKRLDETILPGFEKHIVTQRMMDPRDFVTRYRAYRGAGFCLEPILSQSAWFRPHNRSEKAEGLFLVGAGTHPGAGVPSVLSSARTLEPLIPAIRGHAYAGGTPAGSGTDG
ncbi:MAG: phytoene desaturase family protein [Pseudomonadota bacterium]